MEDHIDLTWTPEAENHIRTRSDRYPGAHDIDPAWTLEAANDPDRVWIEPDPKSIDGRGVRIIGYSRSSRMVVTVIALRADDRLYGQTAWPASGRERRMYEMGDTP